jgi:hypothetical protein
MTTKNLWGQLPDFAPIKTPYAILLEQAAMLRELTNGLLVGDVKRSQNGPVDQLMKEDRFEIKLLIVAPALANYSYTVLTIIYPVITLYPVTLKPSYEEDKSVECQSEEQLMQALEKVLSSVRTQKVITNLLAQIQADNSYQQGCQNPPPAMRAV